MRPIDPPLTEQLPHFRRTYRPTRRLFKGPIELVSLVNVVLLFLLFMIIQSPFVIQPGIVVNLPTSSFTAGMPYGAMVVTISQEGLVFFNDERTTLEGLGPVFAQAVFEHPDSSLVIEADGRVQYGALVQIYNTAAAAGVKNIVLATRTSLTGK